jgi:hypothetical protein
MEGLMALLYDIPDDRLREAVRLAWERSDVSLRSLGKEIGLTPAGLLKFLHGAQPRLSTRKRLSQWYLEQGLQSTELGVAEAFVLFSRLCPELEADLRRALMQSWATVIGVAYQSRGIRPPPWVAELTGDTAGHRTT